uniref:Forkhead box protein N4-like n=2 Tax=Petromyzon marinus TaxID=7757 RepID=A0AAJ7SQK9_PETMA|nr:forkhead box protein N4-like [Petromyzon marinus]
MLAMADWLLPVASSEEASWLTVSDDEEMPVSNSTFAQATATYALPSTTVKMQCWAQVKSDMARLDPLPSLLECGGAVAPRDTTWTMCGQAGEPSPDYPRYRQEGPCGSKTGLQSSPSTTRDHISKSSYIPQASNAFQNTHTDGLQGDGCLSVHLQREQELSNQNGYSSDTMSCATGSLPGTPNLAYGGAQQIFDFPPLYCAASVDEPPYGSSTDANRSLYGAAAAGASAPPPYERRQLKAGPALGHRSAEHLAGHAPTHSPPPYGLHYPRRAQSLPEPLLLVSFDGEGRSDCSAAPPYHQAPRAGGQATAAAAHNGGFYGSGPFPGAPSLEAFQMDKETKTQEYNMGSRVVNGNSMHPVPPGQHLDFMQEQHRNYLPVQQIHQPYPAMRPYSNGYASHQYSPHKIHTMQGRQQKVYPKPIYSYSCLIAMALKNSKNGSLPVSDIYHFMTENFPYFKTAPDGWKNSVRHNLSLNKCFEKIENKASGGSSRKGCLWTLNPAKVDKMDEEMQKWKRKDPVAIRRSMANPEALDRLVVDKADKMSSSVSAGFAPRSNPMPPQGVPPQIMPARPAGSPRRSRLPSDGPDPCPGPCQVAVLHSPQPVVSASSHGTPEHGQVQSQENGCGGLVSGDHSMEVDSINPSIIDLEIQSSLWDAYQQDNLSLEGLGNASDSLCHSPCLSEHAACSVTDTDVPSPAYTCAASTADCKATGGISAIFSTPPLYSSLGDELSLTYLCNPAAGAQLVTLM